MLLISDAEQFADRIVSVLRVNRIGVVTVDTCRQALALVPEHLRPRAVVVDIERAAHWSSCEDVVAAADRVPCPVVAVTSWTAFDGRFRRRAFGVGCAGFVRKAIAREVLASALQRVTSGERRIDYSYRY